MTFCPSKFSQLGLPRLWGPRTLHANLWLKWGLKQSCSPGREISNSMSHATCMPGNRGDSRFLMIGSQIINLTFDPSFGHNLCFRCPNESCGPILNIYIPRYFQWYKEHHNPLSFDPCNYSMKIQESIRTPTPKKEAPLEVWRFIPSHFPTLSGAYSMTLGLPLLACNFASPCLGREPKARVVTILKIDSYILKYISNEN